MAVDIKAKLRAAPTGPGVYIMRDRLGSILYVGKAKNLKRRLSQYFQNSRRKNQYQQPKVQAMLPLIDDFEVHTVKNETEALLLEGRFIKHYQPKYNTLFRDDKRFPLIRVSVQKPIPAFSIVRNRLADGAQYYGPFVTAGPLRTVLETLRKKFGVVLADTQPQRLDTYTEETEDDLHQHWRLYDDVRAEIYTHENIITPAQYAHRVAAACQFLDGKAKDALKNYEAQMQKAAENQDYEKAAKLKSVISSLRTATEPARRFTQKTLVQKQSQAHSAVSTLQEALGLAHAPTVIEGFDISHVSGSFTVASMVQFKNGKPNKSNYRRYKIRSATGVQNDDYASMEEVVHRRYTKLVEGNHPLPNLILIDGGAGQVSSALAAFTKAGIPPLPLIGLAKREEAIIFPQSEMDEHGQAREPLKLPHTHPGLRLLQQVRDESHRFANTFNAHLRSQALKASVLDGFPGLGPARKQALLAHFGSLTALRKATLQDIQTIPGIGPKMAANLQIFLKANR